MPRLVAFLLLAGGARAEGPLDPGLVAPQAIVTVSEHATGADLVKVSMVSSGFPETTLGQVCQSIGRECGSEPRGLVVQRVPIARDLYATQASFATDGLIDRPSGELRLQPIVRGFLGVAAPHEVRSILVSFVGERPVDGLTISDYRSETIVLKAVASEAPLGIEYRVLALTQDPARLSIPARHGAEGRKPKVVDVPRKGPDAAVVALVVVATLSAAALVYSALAKPGIRRQSAAGGTGRPNA